MQRITIAGNVGKDAEIRRTPKGDSVAGFSVAVSKGKDSPTTWWDCSLWGVRAEKLAPYIKKGGKLCVVGEFSTREYEGKTYLQCRVDDVFFGSRAEGSAQDYAANTRVNDDLGMDEIPF